MLTSAGLATGSYTNYALNFNNTSGMVSIPNHSDINLGTHSKRTVEAWFKVDDKTRTHKQTIYEEGAQVRGLNIYIHTDGTLYGGAWNEPGGESNWNGHWIGWNNVQDNTWHHVAVTLNGGSSITPNALKMYVDGQLISTGSGSKLWQHGGNIRIGRNGGTKFHTGDEGGSGESFYGDIDEVRIWNVERTASQIADAKDGALNGDETGLVAYYNFQENSGTTANDSQTLSNNDGTIS
ncbi:MAG: LamG domain-containing protein, partial [Candidatus Neomarinimicrobiota bacterium]|nr:LamG domain-containing protein [Candidatus Neomarinimicrobiota bacterium]